MTTDPIESKWSVNTEISCRIMDLAPNYNVCFYSNTHKAIGKLDFNGPKMIFEGDAEESAKIFFDFIARNFEEYKEWQKHTAIKEQETIG